MPLKLKGTPLMELLRPQDTAALSEVAMSGLARKLDPAGVIKTQAGQTGVPYAILLLRRILRNKGMSRQDVHNLVSTIERGAMPEGYMAEVDKLVGKPGKSVVQAVSEQASVAGTGIKPLAVKKTQVSAKAPGAKPISIGETKVKTAYAHGFVVKCAEYGVEPERLLKQAAPPVEMVVSALGRKYSKLLERLARPELKGADWIKEVVRRQSNLAKARQGLKTKGFGTAGVPHESEFEKLLYRR